MIEGLQTPPCKTSPTPRDARSTSVDTACEFVSSARSPASGLHRQQASVGSQTDSAGGPARRRHAAGALLQVIDALEALHACPFPSSSRLAASLLCSAATQLNTATYTSLSTVSSAALSSAICSLILHFSANHHDLVTSLTGQEATRVSKHHGGPGRGKPHSASVEFRTARRLAERYLPRILAAWSARVIGGRVRSSTLSRACIASQVVPEPLMAASPERRLRRRECAHAMQPFAQPRHCCCLSLTCNRLFSAHTSTTAMPLPR